MRSWIGRSSPLLATLTYIATLTYKRRYLLSCTFSLLIRKRKKGAPARAPRVCNRPVAARRRCFGPPTGAHAGRREIQPAHLTPGGTPAVAPALRRCRLPQKPCAPYFSGSSVAFPFWAKFGGLVSAIRFCALFWLRSKICPCPWLPPEKIKGSAFLSGR